MPKGKESSRTQETRWAPSWLSWNWGCPRPFIWSRHRDRLRKEESNNFPRHRRTLEIKFNLSELYSHPIDWFRECIEQISHWLGGLGGKPHLQLCFRDFWWQINSVNSVPRPSQPARQPPGCDGVIGGGVSGSLTEFRDSFRVVTKVASWKWPFLAP